MTGKRHPLNMRTTREIRTRLEEAAAAAGRSLAQEVEFRLERSFDVETIVRLAVKAALDEIRGKGA